MTKKARTYDVISLIEASDKYAPNIGGYRKLFCDRKYTYNKYRNGILLYIKDEYNPQVCNEVRKELIDNKIACFMPMTIDKNNEILHCFFVWSTVKNGEDGNREPYGYYRFDEIFKEKEFVKTRQFLDGEKYNVIVIGDFNITVEKKDNWKKFIFLMKKCGLKWVENKNKTCGSVTNDHCFVSGKLHSKSNVKVGKNNYLQFV